MNHFDLVQGDKTALNDLLSKAGINFRFEDLQKEIAKYNDSMNQESNISAINLLESVLKDFDAEKLDKATTKHFFDAKEEDKTNYHTYVFEKDGKTIMINIFFKEGKETNRQISYALHVPEKKQYIQQYPVVNRFTDVNMRMIHLQPNDENKNNYLMNIFDNGQTRQLCLENLNRTHIEDSFFFTLTQENSNINKYGIGRKIIIENQN